MAQYASEISTQWLQLIVEEWMQEEILLAAKLANVSINLPQIQEEIQDVQERISNCFTDLIFYIIVHVLLTIIFYLLI